MLNLFSQLSTVARNDTAIPIAKLRASMPANSLYLSMSAPALFSCVLRHFTSSRTSIVLLILQNAKCEMRHKRKAASSRLTRALKADFQASWHQKGAKNIEYPIFSIQYSIDKFSKSLISTVTLGSDSPIAEWLLKRPRLFFRDGTWSLGFQNRWIQFWHNFLGSTPVPSQRGTQGGFYQIWFFSRKLSCNSEEVWWRFEWFLLHGIKWGNICHSTPRKPIGRF